MLKISEAIDTISLNLSISLEFQRGRHSSSKSSNVPIYRRLGSGTLLFAHIQAYVVFLCRKNWHFTIMKDIIVEGDQAWMWYRTGT